MVLAGFIRGRNGKKGPRPLGPAKHYPGAANNRTVFIGIFEENLTFKFPKIRRVLPGHPGASLITFAGHPDSCPD
jgi:hypothetical protein